MEEAPTHKSPQTADKQNSSFHFASLNQVCNEDLLSAIAGGAAYGLRHRTFDELHVLHRRSNLQEVTWAQVEKEAQPILPDARNEAWRPLLSSQLRNSAHADSTGTARRDRAGVCSGMDSVRAEIAPEYRVPPGTVKVGMRLGFLHLLQVQDQMGFTAL